jgi:FlaA1/EpsC-like NDP-sugar epimerase
MKSMSVGNLLEAMIRKYHPDGKTHKVKTIGLQPGENLHEVIVEDGPNSSEVERFTIEEIIELV